MPKDTTQAIEMIYLEKLRQKTDAQRALMGFSMFETARYLVETSLPEKMTAQDKKIALFNRFYGSEFEGKVKENIVQYLRGA